MGPPVVCAALVKRFGTIGAENLTRPKTAPHFDLVKSIFWSNLRGRQHRLDNTGPLPERGPGVSFVRIDRS
jgi:hypothetical protein